LNDEFKVVSVCPEFNYFRMEIFNRWGELMYETGDITQGWDGTKNGKPCLGQAYAYKISYEITGFERAGAQVYTGVVVLVK
jgi:gliding motility-associated-like protein